MRKKVCVRIRTNVRREYLEKKIEIAENGEDEEDRRRRRSLVSSVAIYEEFCFVFFLKKEKKIRKRKKTVYSYLFLVFYSYFFP